MNDTGVNKTPTKTYPKGNSYRHCIICGNDILLLGRRYSTLFNKNTKQTLSKIIDVSGFNNERRVCTSCYTKAENVDKYLKKCIDDKRFIIEKFDETRKLPPTEFSIKRLPKSQSPGRSPTSTSTGTSRKRLCLAPIKPQEQRHPSSRKKLLPESDKISSGKENLIPLKKSMRVRILCDYIFVWVYSSVLNFRGVVIFSNSDFDYF